MCAKLDPSTFDTDVLGSAALWIILYHGGLKDMKSAEAKVNFLRLASDLEGRARLGMLDCEAHAADLLHAVPRSFSLVLEAHPPIGWVLALLHKPSRGRR